LQGNQRTCGAFHTRRSAAEVLYFADLAIARIDGQLTAMDRYLRSLFVIPVSSVAPLASEYISQ
jgi:hypothetical protein